MREVKQAEENAPNSLMQLQNGGHDSISIFITLLVQQRVR